MNGLRPQRRHVIAGGASLLLLSACGSLIGPANEPGKIYVLAPNLSASPGGAHMTAQLSVSRPAASASLTTDRIAIVRGGVMDYYADAQWTDAVPDLVQGLLVEAFEKNAVAAARDAEGIKADYILKSEVRAFEARYAEGDAPPTIAVDITMKLISPHSAAIVATRDFHEEIAAGANSVASAVAAFDQAMSAMLADVFRWVLVEASPHR